MPRVEPSISNQKQNIVPTMNSKEENEPSRASNLASYLRKKMIATSTKNLAVSETT